MKICPKCGIEKSLNEFHKNKSKPDGVQIYCKLCKSSYDRNQYQVTDKSIKRLQQKVLTDRNRDFIRQYKMTHPCVDCGESRWQVLDFDHLGTDKKYNVANMVTRFCRI